MAKLTQRKVFLLISTLLLFVITALSSVNIVAKAEGWNNNNGLGFPGEGIAGKWYALGSSSELTNGTTGAWKGFVSRANSGSYNGNGAEWDLRHLIRNPSQQLVDDCKKSQFIWYYQKNNNGLSTWAGNNVHPPANKMPMPTGDFGTTLTPLEIFNKALADMPKSAWSSAPNGAVIVCSYKYQTPPKKEIILQGNSGEFIYDGSAHTVKGWTLAQGKLEAGDRVEAVAMGTRIQVGSGPVDFKSPPKVMRGDVDVTNLYIVHVRDGKLVVKPREVEKPRNCVTRGSEKVRANVTNKVTMSPGYVPVGGLSFSQASKTYKTVAHGMDATLPNIGDSRSKWSSWKAAFEKGNEDKKTEELILDDSQRDIMKSMMTYGGVINVTRTHTANEADVTFCQPQTRDSYIDDETGETYWGPWYDYGEEKIEKISYNYNPPKKDKLFSYQILGVNCNAEGYNQVKADFDIAKEISPSGNEVGGGLLFTKEEEGTNFVLGQEFVHYSGEEGFYKPGRSVQLHPSGNKEWVDSCKKAFEGACTAEVIKGSSKNDAHNNLSLSSSEAAKYSNEQYNREYPLFAETDEFYRGGIFANLDKIKNADEKATLFNNRGGASHGVPKIDGASTSATANFFRDNQPRMVRADVWRLKKENIKGPFTIIGGEGAEARQTRIMGKEGTPEASITNFQFLDSGKKYQNVPLDKEADFKGSINKFVANSQWASNDENPYEAKISWAYDVNVQVFGASSLDGYRVTSGLKWHDFDFDVHCAFENEYSDDGRPGYLSDNPMIRPRTVDVPWEDVKGSVKVQFNRAVSDKSDVQGK